MSRSILIRLSAGVILVAFAALPPMLPGSTTMSLSGSALAQKTPTTDATNLNSSRSNIYRMGGGGGTTSGKTKKQGGSTKGVNGGAALNPQPEPPNKNKSHR